MKELIFFYSILDLFHKGIFRLAEFIACLSLVGYKDINHILLKFVNKISY